MMAKTLSHPLTVRELLFGRFEGNPRVLMDRLKKSGILEQMEESALEGGDNIRQWLSRIRLKEIREDLGKSLSGMLEMDLGELFLQGFLKYRGLKDAAEDSVMTPYRAAHVTLGKAHESSSTYKLRAKVFIDNVHWSTLDFELTVTLTVEGLVAQVRDGRLVELLAGKADVTATLAWKRRDGQGIKLASKKVPLRLRPVVRLGDGFSLLTEEERELLEEERERLEEERGLEGQNA